MVSNKVDKTNVIMKALENMSTQLMLLSGTALRIFLFAYYKCNMSFVPKLVNKDVRFYEARNARAKDSGLRTNLKAKQGTEDFCYRPLRKVQREESI